MIEFVTRSLTFFIPSKKLRTKYRIKLKTLYYARIMLHKAKSIGKNFVAGVWQKYNNWKFRKTKRDA